MPTPVPKFQTFKNQVKLAPGQTLGFQLGRGYYAKTPAPPVVPNYLAPLSPQEIARQAAATAQSNIHNESYPITSQIDAGNQSTIQRIQALRDLFTSISPSLAALGPRLAGQATQSAEEQRLLGGDFAANAAANLGQGEQGNRSFVESQVAGTAPSAAPDTGQFKDVANYVGATLPGQAELTTGMGDAAALDLAPAQAAAETQAAARTLSIDQQNQEQQLRAQLVDIAQKFPQYRQEALDALNTIERNKVAGRVDLQNANTNALQARTQQQAQDLYAKKFDETVKSDTALIEHRKTMDALAEKKYQTSISTAERKGRTIDAAASKVLGYIVDKNGNPVLQNGKKIPVKGSAATGGITKTSKASALTSASKTAYSAAISLLGKPIKNQTGIGGIYVAKPGAKGVFPGHGLIPATTNDPGKAQRDGAKITFAEAMDRVWAAIGADALVSQYGFSANQLRQQIRAQLVRAGWKPDGQRPRQNGR